MTKLLPGATAYNTSTGDPSASPVPGGVMNGNPDPNNDSEFGRYPPGPQTGGVAQTVNSPLSHDQIARGNIPLNSAPTSGVAQGAATPGSTNGTDSLMAQMSRGQVSLNQSNYGQPVSVPAVGGSSPQVQPNAAPVPLPNGIASTLTVGAPATYIGD